ncbi:FkbM family methyltransferase [Desertivirga xinjiangensis]|uniref:FkbM family methyltransferase n=1 Tax=Desertivirga xinjiangensis TaxID=539206 RepID=UPI00210D82F5|nr:FkbM family methyltransferase [Pedobacter xinjiangensis]
MKGVNKKDGHRIKMLTLNIFNKKTKLWFRPTQGDLLIFNEVFVEKQYNLPISDEKLDTIIDLGANVGFSSLFFIKKYNPSKLILVEPSEKNLTVAKLNLNYWIGTNQCHFYMAAVHYKKGTVYLDESLAPYNFKTNTTGSSGAVNTVTIPQIMHEHGLNTVDLLKIDIEGAESYLFQQDTDWLRSIRTIVIELHSPLNERWLKEKLEPYGFEIISEPKNHTIFVAINKR